MEGSVNNKMSAENSKTKSSLSSKGSELPSDVRFAEGEKVLCFHGPLIYEAKIQKVAMGKGKDAGQPKFFIHYHGWSKNWDEWVPEARMLKFCDNNLNRKKELVKAHEANVRAKKAATKRKLDAAAAAAATGPGGGVAMQSPLNLPPPLPLSAENTKDAQVMPEEEVQKDVKQDSGDGPSVILEKASRSSSRKSATPTSTTAKKNAKRVQVSAKELQNDLSAINVKLDSTVETEDQFYTKVEVKIKVPDELKPYLVDDWDYLSRQRKLVMLPARVTVDEVITDYIKYKTSSKSSSSTKNNKENAVLEVTAGLKEYFNVMLGSQLLYKFEREQHADIIKEHPNSPMVKIYGPIHFLRLFVKLGGMLTYTPLDEKSIQLLLYYINDILTYMKKHASTLFMISDYGTASPEYHRRAL